MNKIILNLIVCFLVISVVYAVDGVSHTGNEIVDTVGPISRLNVFTPSGSTGVNLTTDGNNTPFVLWDNRNDGREYIYGIRQQDNWLYFRSYRPNSTSLWSGGRTEMIFDPLGNVYFPGNAQVTGNFGIGTTTPEEKLHIYSADSGAKIVAETEGTGLGDNAYLVLKTPETRTSDVQFWVGDEGRFRIARHQDNYLTLGAFRDSTWQEDLNVMPDGRVGIGTNDPQSDLHISSDETRVRLNSEDPSANTGINFQNEGNDDNRWQIGKRGIGGAPGDDNDFYIDYYNGVSWNRPFEITTGGDVSISGDLNVSGNINGFRSSPWIENANSISYSGSVGIGTSSPEERLHVVGTVKISNRVITPIVEIRSGEGSGYTGIFNYDSNNNAMTDSLRINSNKNIALIIDEANMYDDAALVVFKDGPGNFPLLKVEESGNVGIGTNDPQSNLHISSDETRVRLNSNDPTKNTGINFQNANDVNNRWQIGKRGIGGNPLDDNDFYIDYYNGVSWNRGLEVSKDGNIGIGTSTPTAKLDVNGDVIIGSDLQVSGNLEVIGDSDISGGAIRTYDMAGMVEIGSSNNEKDLWVSGNLRVDGVINGGFGSCLTMNSNWMSIMATQTCNSGYRLVGGGGRCQTAAIVSNYPSNGVWTVSCVTGQGQAFAICCPE